MGKLGSRKSIPIVQLFNSLNVRRVYDMSLPAERSAGLSWYAEAHKIASQCPARALAGAGILAALSPQLSWGRNVLGFFEFIADGNCHQQSAANNLKAMRIYKGEDPLEVLGGPKTLAFFACILHPERNDVVCIDRHAFSVAAGRVLSDKERGWLDTNHADYLAAQECYLAPAEALDIVPSQLQAITWLTHRRLKAEGFYKCTETDDEGF